MGMEFLCVLVLQFSIYNGVQGVWGRGILADLGPP